MKNLTPIEAWHEAFNTEVQSVDVSGVAACGRANSVQRINRKIVRQVERAFLQQVIAQIKARDLIAWAWGMTVYAPAGVSSKREKQIVYDYLRCEFFRQCKTNYFDIHLARLDILILLACHDVAYMEQSGRYHSRKHANMSKALEVSEDEYKKVWLAHFNRLKDLARDLSQRASAPLNLFLTANQKGGNCEMRAALGLEEAAYGRV